MMSKAKNKYYSWGKEKYKWNTPCLRFDNEHKDEVNLHLRLLLEAINKVKPEYFTYALDGLPIPKEYRNNGLIKHTERVFAYELYYQWSKLIDKRTWVLNAEIRKHLELFKNCYNNQNISLESQDRNKRRSHSWNFPDLVLHKGQNKNFQMIACEIKRFDRLKKDFAKDIETLFKMTRVGDIYKVNENGEQLNPYRCGVFLIINCTYNSLESIIKESIPKLVVRGVDLVNSQNIICIFYNQQNNEIEIGFQSLYNIYNKINE